MIECANCGCKNQFDGAVFCKKCGVALSQQVEFTRLLQVEQAGHSNQVGADEGAAAELRRNSQDATGQSVIRESEPGEASGSEDAEGLQIEATVDLLMPNRNEDRLEAVDSHHVLSDADRSDLIKSLERHLSEKSGDVPAGKRQAPNQIPSPTGDRPSCAGVDRATGEGGDFALLSGNKLVLPKSANLLPGEKIKCGNQEFIVRPLRRDLRSYGLGAALLLLLIVALLSQWFRGSGSDKATLFGLVVDSLSMTIVPGATVTIPDLGVQAQTDGHGSFRIDGLEEGSYRVRIECQDFNPADMPLVMKKGAGYLLRASLAPLTLSGMVLEEDTTGAEQHASAPPANGTLRIRTNVTDVSVIINGKHLGTGDQTFKRIRPGKHVLRLEKGGYEPYRQEIIISAGKTIEVVAPLQAIKEMDEYTAADYFQEAEAHFESRRYEEAIGYYSLAIARDGNLAEAYERQGEANLMLGAKLKAQSDLLAAARIYAAAGKYADAISCHDRILGFAPESVIAFQRRGWASINSGDFDSGLTDLQAALSLNEDDWQARFQLARGYYFTGDYKSAEKHLKKIRKHDDEFPLINGYLALAYLGKGDESEARKYFHEFTEQATAEDLSRMVSEPAWQRLLTLAAAED